MIAKQGTNSKILERSKLIKKPDHIRVRHYDCNPFNPVCAETFNGK